MNATNAKPESVQQLQRIACPGYEATAQKICKNCGRSFHNNTAIITATDAREIVGLLERDESELFRLCGPEGQPPTLEQSEFIRAFALRNIDAFTAAGLRVLVNGSPLAA